MWDALHEAGSRVVVLKDAPRPRLDVLECVADHDTEPEACAVSRKTAFSDPGHATLEKAVRAAADVQLLDLTDRFCSPVQCMPVIGNVMVYRDHNHITDTYARSLRPYIAEALWPAAGSAAQHAGEPGDR
jgi:hypothetical protein